MEAVWKFTASLKLRTCSFVFISNPSIAQIHSHFDALLSQADLEKLNLNLSNWSNTLPIHAHQLFFFSRLKPASCKVIITNVSFKPLNSSFANLLSQNNSFGIRPSQDYFILWSWSHRHSPKYFEPYLLQDPFRFQIKNKMGVSFTLKNDSNTL